MLDLMLIPNMLTSERIAFWPMADLWGHQPLYFDQVAAIYQHYTVMKARMKVTIVPNTVDAYVSGILIDDDLTPAITTLDGMAGTAFGCFKTSAGRWGGHYLQELGC